MEHCSEAVELGSCSTGQMVAVSCRTVAASCSTPAAAAGAVVGYTLAAAEAGHSWVSDLWRYSTLHAVVIRGMLITCIYSVSPYYYIVHSL